MDTHGTFLAVGSLADGAGDEDGALGRRGADAVKGGGVEDAVVDDELDGAVGVAEGKEVEALAHFASEERSDGRVRLSDRRGGGRGRGSRGGQEPAGEDDGLAGVRGGERSAVVRARGEGPWWR